MKAASIEYFIDGDRTRAVRIKTDDGKTYVFVLEWQKLLAGGTQACLVCESMGDEFPKSKLQTEFGEIPEEAWMTDPVICRIVDDARKASIDETFEPGPVPVSRYYPEVGEP